jgi:hypothetical protein
MRAFLLVCSCFNIGDNGMKKLVCIMVASLLFCPPSYGQSDELLAAIRQVESSGNDKAVGDNGRAIGPYQIHYGYWRDAVEYDKSIGGTYADCYNPEYSCKIVRAYMKRYAPKGVSNEVYARIHNGGPRGHLNKKTEAYWAKVRRELK